MEYGEGVGAGKGELVLGNSTVVDTVEPRLEKDVQLSYRKQKGNVLFRVRCIAHIFSEKSVKF